MCYSPEKKERGFTLIELLIAMAISGIVLGALISTFIIQSKSYDVQEQIAEMTQTARAAMDMMTREIRLAGYDPTGLAAFNGITYNASQLQIRADLNDDGNTDDPSPDDPNENIVYAYYDATDQIKRKTGGGYFQPFAENIQGVGGNPGFTFVYRDSSGNLTTTTANIRQVEITITARTGKPDPNYTDNGGYRTYMLTSLITPPNLDY